jgi:hypothetical protein
LVAFQIDKGDPDIGLLLPSQFGRRIDHNDLKRRPYLAFDKMTAARRAVRQAEHDVNVKARLAIVADGDVSDCAQDLALLRDLDSLVGFLVKIEPPDHGLLEGPDGGKGRRVNPGIVCEFRQSRKCLFAGIEDDDAGFGSRVAGTFLLFMAAGPAVLRVPPDRNR